EPRRLVERSPGEARAAAGVGQRGRALRVVERRGHEDQPGEDQGERGEPEGKRRRDPERVVDARADVAVAGGEQRPHPQRPGQLRLASQPDAHVSRAVTRPRNVAAGHLNEAGYWASALWAACTS